MLVTQDRLRVSVSSLPGPWRTASGLGGERDVTKLRQEAGGPKVALPGPQELQDVTTTRAFDAQRDSGIVVKLKAGDMFPNTTITLTPLDENYNAIPGKSIPLPGCRVKSWEYAEADADSAETAHLQIVWTVA